MITRRQFATALAGISAGAVLARSESAWADQPPLRIAVSMEMLAGANLNDARAAYRIFADQISQALALRHAQILDQVFIPSAELIQMIRTGQVDFIALTAFEYARAADLIDPAWMLVEDNYLDGLEYLLLVRSDSSYASLQDLKGAKLRTHHHPNDSLLQPWLTVQLASAGHMTFNEFFPSADSMEKVSEVVLPLFFGSAHAAALSRPEFDAAVELNPQLGRQLRVLLTSPKVYPCGFWVRKDCNAEDKRVFEQAMLRLNTVPAGRQALVLFQTSGYSPRSCSIMAPTLELIRQYETLAKRSGGRAS